MKVRIETIKETQQITDNFSKREFVVVEESNPDYPTPIKFEVVNDKCSMLDNYNEGDIVDLEYNIRGRKWKKDEQSEEVVFNSLQVWKINKHEGAHDFTPESDQAQNTADWMNTSDPDGIDDLPF